MSFLFFLVFIFTLFYFIILFCHTLTWIRHGCTWVPNPEPSSHPISSLWIIPRAPAPSILCPFFTWAIHLLSPQGFCTVFICLTFSYTNYTLIWLIYLFHVFSWQYMPIVVTLNWNCLCMYLSQDPRYLIFPTPSSAWHTARYPECVFWTKEWTSGWVG